MYYPTFAAMGWAMFVFWLLGIFVLIAWILLPFAMFGIKPLLRDLVTATKETNRLLAAAQTSSPPLTAERSPPGP